MIAPTRADLTVTEQVSALPHDVRCPYCNRLLFKVITLGQIAEIDTVCPRSNCRRLVYIQLVQVKRV